METTEPMTDEQAVARLLAPVNQPAGDDAPEEDDVQVADMEAEGQAPEASEDVAEEESDVQDQPKTFRVKVDGKEVEVTEDELKRGYSGQAYIQKGMQEVAEARKAFEAERQALQEAQAKLADFVANIQQNGIKEAPRPPDVELANTDPVGYVQARARYEAEMQAYQAQQSQFQQMQAQRQQMTAQQMQAHLAEQQRILAERIPDFADPEKATVAKQRLVSAGREYGFSAEELGGITDARAVQVLHDAAQWRAFQAGKAQGQQPKAPPSVKPSAKRPEPAQLQRAKQLEQARKTQSTQDWASLLLTRK